MSLAFGAVIEFIFTQLLVGGKGSQAAVQTDWLGLSTTTPLNIHVLLHQLNNTEIDKTIFFSNKKNASLIQTYFLLLFIAHPLLGRLIAEVQCSRVPINSYASIAYYSLVIVTLYNTPSAEPEDTTERKEGQSFTYDGSIHTLGYSKFYSFSSLLVPRTPGTRVPISLHNTQRERVVVAQTVITTEKHNSKR